jgi:hypothetical protein
MNSFQLTLADLQIYSVVHNWNNYSARLMGFPIIYPAAFEGFT